MSRGWAAFSADTDGHDGSTEAAGGIVDGETAQKIRDAAWTRRRRCRTTIRTRRWRLVKALLVTGPTGTNVNDLRVALVSPSQRG